jgi:Na+-translocating ferredoxin:NAD+ oxidoreductase RnfG subunit
MESQTIGIILAILSAGAAVLTGVIRLQSGINQMFTEIQAKDEARTSGIYQRLEAMDQVIDRTYVRKDLHEAHMERIGGEIGNLRSSIACPAPDRN